MRLLALVIPAALVVYLIVHVAHMLNAIGGAL